MKLTHLKKMNATTYFFFCRHFVLHPPVQKLIPGLADVPISDLQGNDMFHAIAHTSMRIANYLINNLDNDELLSAVLAKITVSDYFVDYMDPIHQLDVSSFIFKFPVLFNVRSLD